MMKKSRMKMQKKLFYLDQDEQFYFSDIIWQRNDRFILRELTSIFGGESRPYRASGSLMNPLKETMSRRRFIKGMTDNRYDSQVCSPVVNSLFQITV